MAFNLKRFSLILPGLFTATLGVICFSVPFAIAKEKLDEQYQLEEITVTADKREEDVQKVPTSITTLSDIQLEDSNIKTAEELFSILPNIHLMKSGPAADLASTVSIRGITQFMSGAPSFGFYVDDVYYNEYDLNLFDIERIELLRGPQGTLYGRNTLAGVLNIVTKKPDNYWDNRLSAGYGNLNTLSITGVLSGPLVEDKLFIRIAGQHESSDGFMENAFNGNSSVNGPKNTDGKLYLRYLPTDKLKFDLGLDALKYKSKYTDFVLLSEIDSNPHKANVDYEGDSLKEAYGANLRTEYQAEDMKLISITAIRQDDNKLDHDMDFTPVDGQIQLYQRDYFTLSEELRFVSDYDNSPLEWLAGLYAFKEEQDHSYVYTLGKDWEYPAMGYFAGDYPVTGEGDTTGAAIFGEVSFTFTDSIKLTGGLRYDWETQDLDYNNTSSGAEGSNSTTFDALLPKIAASYVANETYMPYVTISKGYKSGGFNIVNSTGTKFDQEYTWNYEAGIKTNWLDRRLSINTALYHIDWSDLQVNASDGISFLTTNAGAASSDGIELELFARPTDGLDIVGSLTYTKSSYDEYYVQATSGGGFDSPQPAIDFSDNYLPYVPKFKAHFDITYRLLNGIFTNLNYTYTGKVYMNNENTLAEGGYSLVNAKIGYEREHFEIYAWAKNLFDEEYATSYVDFRESGGGLWARAGAPQTFGISIQYRF
jgi:iron complex outermembrane recepter protein